ncbi:MAG: hypothetical protein Q9209_003910 [Squamulea sp. 1 TL-2023]
MSQLRNKEEVFEEIDALASEARLEIGDSAVDRKWFKARIDERRSRYPFMAYVDFGHYLEWGMAKIVREVQAAEAVPKPTNADFWKAAYDYDPLGPNPPGDGSALQKILTSGRMERIPIGRIYGRTLLKLLPVIGALPAPDNPDFEAPFDYAATDSVAISYQDGHLSEEELASQRTELPSGAMTHTPATIKAKSDDILRRFAALGWVLQEAPNGEWNKTGHVLVIDMDDRDVRHRHPWLILASEWPTDGAETSEGGFTIYAEDEVDRDESAVLGVFPGDNDRTTIFRIKPRAGETNVPVIERLGDAFDFVPDHPGGQSRTTIQSGNGPALADVMEWYWDPITEQEVCYTKHGFEYMRYDRKAKEYSYSDFR